MAIPFTPLTFSNNMPSGYALDENFTAVQTALQSGLSRTSSTDNEMQIDLDLNSNDILNVNKISAADFQFDSINNQSIQELVDEAYNWAQHPVDDLVPEGNGLNEYSAFHYSVKAGNSATAASDSEAASLASEQAAATSESNAATSENNTQAILDEFEDKYWGSFSSEPALSPNGNTADEGDLYLNTTTGFLNIYLNGAWESINDYVSRTSPTGAAVLPTGTTAERPTGQAGYFRYNDELDTFEGHDGTEWGGIGGATGAGGNPVFYENDQTVTGDYTIPGDKNAMSSGPIEVATGVTVTVSDGAIWHIL